MSFGENFYRQALRIGALLMCASAAWALKAATWEWQAAKSAFAPFERQAHSAVWTGQKLLIWGGRIASSVGTNTATGGFYDPQTASWTPIITNGAPVPRSRHVTVWTGSKMLVWGGVGPGVNTSRRDGGLFDFPSGSWQSISTNNSPVGRSDSSAVWTGSHLLVWGGVIGLNYRKDGGRYDLATDSWQPISTNGTPSPRALAITGWTGNRMLVVGGIDGTNRLTDGGLYDPATDSWSTINPTNAPAAITPLVGVWTGSRVIVWTSTNSLGVAEGAIYNPATDSWQSISTNGGFSGVAGTQTAVAWSGTEFYICDAKTGAGARYNPTTDTWLPVTPYAAPISTLVPTRFSATWAGGELILFGGNTIVGTSPATGEGKRYSPVTESWSDLFSETTRRSYAPVAWTGGSWLSWGGDNPNGAPSVTQSGFSHDPVNDVTTLIPNDGNAPFPRRQNTAVWSGTELLVWGGWNVSGVLLATGSRYNPATAMWSAMSTVNGPGQRTLHSAVWTGEEMLIWGGRTPTIVTGSGKRYRPDTDSWSNMSSLPAGRVWHTAIWAGSNMLVWGGATTEFSGGAALNSGGIYVPNTDQWTAVSQINAPTNRYQHSAVWTGTNLIIWGGWDGTNYFGDGSRYDPATSNWTAISSLNAPSPRYNHSAVWTGTEMIVWGGRTPTGETNNGGHYHPATDTWTPMGADNLPPSRAGHSASWTGTHMLIFGGYAGVQNKNDIFRYGPNPYSGDAIDDLWQTFHFGPDNPRGAGSGDVDGDGLSNEFEFVAGLNPTNALSTFSLSISQPGNSRELSFGPVFTNRVYELIATPNLSIGNWTNVNASATNNAGFTRTLTDSTGSTNQNYRVRITLQ